MDRQQELRNLLSREALQARLDAETEPRTTLSFYRYAHIEYPQAFRDDCFARWSALGVLGRIYVATEGINGQLSVPTSNLADFREALYSIPFLQGTRLNIAIEAEAKSFLKLIIKVRPKIVADGLDDNTFDVTKRGRHLSAREVNELLDRDDTIVVDMRNHYESEVGYFEGAIRPEVTNFREILPVVEELLEDKKDREIVMYCTGGIRCEKASAYYLHRGFERVSMVDGGIIEYARQCEREGLEKKYIGKNFVFDERLGERITEDVVSKCHQCGQPTDRQLDCANKACHILFIQCDACARTYENCCSEECRDFNQLPEDERKQLAPTKIFNGQRLGKAMRLTILLVSLFFTLGCGAQVPSFSEQEQALTVMSYNVRLNVESDGENAWPHRKEFLVSQVLFHAPDIIGTQEVTPGQLDYLKEHLTPYAYLGVGREGGNKGEYSALFYNRHKFSVQDSGTFWLSTTPDVVASVGWDAALPRIVTYGRFLDRTSGQEFMVFNTHFDHVGEQARVESARLITKMMDSLNRRDLPVILTGDLNLTPETDAIQTLMDSLVDAFEVAPVRLGPAGTFTGFDYSTPAERRIDYIMVSPGIEVVNFATLTDAIDGRYPSDHFPVVATLHLRPRMMVIAHRGASGHAVENSLQAFQKAIDMGADMMELDVWRLKNGTIVVFHDEDLKRLTDTSGKIEDFTLAELNQVMLGGAYKIPRLRDVFELADKQIRINVELKGANTADGTYELIQEYIRDHGWKLEDFQISSFNHDELWRMRELSPNIEIAILPNKGLNHAIEVAKDIGAQAINAHFGALNIENVRAMHAAGLKVNAWTVNEKVEMRRLREMGVDGVITNFPDRAFSLD